LLKAFSLQCGKAKAIEIDAKIGAAIRKSGTAMLNYERTLEGIRHCGVLKGAKGAELAADIAAG